MIYVNEYHLGGVSIDSEPCDERYCEACGDYDRAFGFDSLKEKVKIPQFIADYVDAFEGKDIYALLVETLSHGASQDVPTWLGYDDEFGHGNLDNEMKLIKAWIDGYEVDREQLYTVKLSNGSVLIKDPEFNSFQLCKAPKEQIEGYEYKLTRSEIESVDSILMGIAKPVEEE